MRLALTTPAMASRRWTLFTPYTIESLAEGNTELGGMVCKAKITGQREVTAATQAIAGDGSDHRFADIRDRGRAVIDRNFIFCALILVFSLMRVELRHIGADTEIRTRTCQHNRANVVIAARVRKTGSPVRATCFRVTALRTCGRLRLTTATRSRLVRRISGICYPRAAKAASNSELFFVSRQQNFPVPLPSSSLA